jgi:hypothetical protein
MRSSIFVLALATTLFACSSESTPASPTSNVDPSQPSDGPPPASETSSTTTPPPPPPPPPDTGSSGSSGKPPPPTYPKDAGGYDANVPPAPAAFTKSEIQTLFTSRCAPCHIANASAGMSLANDFTTSTVGVASYQVPSLKRIEKGDRNKSYLFHKLRGTHLTVGGSGVRMPKSGPPYLSEVEIERIGLYIDGL